jgi:phage tail protein X
MPMFKIKLAEPVRMFPAYGDLHDGDVIDAAEQPADGVTWTWVETVAKTAEPVAADPVMPETALGVTNPDPAAVAAATPTV